jgi:hypothetical protein
MKYKQTIDYLIREMGVTEGQLESSFSKTTVFKGLNIQKADFTLDKTNPEDYLEHCANKVPIKMYDMVVREDKKRRSATVYSHKIIRNGNECIKITTSYRKPVGRIVRNISEDDSGIEEYLQLLREIIEK